MNASELSPRRYLVIQTEPERKPVAIVTETMKDAIRIKIRSLEFVEVVNVRKVGSVTTFERPNGQTNL